MPSFDTICEANLPEVKNAVDNTAKEIATRFDFKGTAAAVDGMKQGVSCVAEGVALSRRAGEAIGRIESGATQVRRDVSDISDALRQQSSASNDIAAKIERIAQMAESNSSEVRRTANAAEDLERLSRTLQAEVDRFVV